jgi:hypothetical protein
MKKELIEKKKELEKELILINEEINLEILRDDLATLNVVTDTLNSLSQSKIVKKYGNNGWDLHSKSSINAPNLLYNSMEILVMASVQLANEIEDLVIELNKDENGK